MRLDRLSGWSKVYADVASEGGSPPPGRYAELAGMTEPPGMANVGKLLTSSAIARLGSILMPTAVRPFEPLAAVALISSDASWSIEGGSGANAGRNAAAIAKAANCSSADATAALAAVGSTGVWFVAPGLLSVIVPLGVFWLSVR